MPSLKTRAREALEGSDRSDEALTALCDYIDDVQIRIVGELALDKIDYAVELLVLLDALKSVADPDGDSPYRMELVKRFNRPGPYPNPAKKSARETDAMFAAAYADKLLEDEPTMQKKAAHSIAATRHGVAVREIYAARKLPLYIELREVRKKRLSHQDPDK